ncbi:MAG: DUF4160 domain-containing protein [Bacteroidales bacterium]|nr:DUF4160 domain-containing protein [Bacteroidales bacterium]
MPKIFEYLGIVFYFYSNEHEPIHVHARYGNYESKAEFYIENGEIIEIKIKTVIGRKPLKGKDLKNLKVFLEIYANEIVQKWIDFFVYHKDIEFKRITKKLK